MIERKEQELLAVEEVVQPGKKGTILVLGDSGVGKSTLINAIARKFDATEELAKVSLGGRGTEKLKSYDCGPFRIIDSIGFEKEKAQHLKVIKAIEHWGHKAIRKETDDDLVSLIWYCIDATGARILPEDVKLISKATKKYWKKAPVFIVLTKSYSEQDLPEFMDYIDNAIALQGGLNKRGIFPVIAEDFPVVINGRTEKVESTGLEELVAATVRIMPDALQIAGDGKKKFLLLERRALSFSVTGAATVSSMALAAIPVPIADHYMLAPLQTGLQLWITKIYDLKKENSEKIVSAMAGAGIATAAAKTAFSTAKAIPGVNVLGSALNAIVAGVFTAMIGGATILMAEKYGSGEIDEEKLAADVQEFFEQFSAQLLNSPEFKELIGSLDFRAIAGKLMKLVTSLFS